MHELAHVSLHLESMGGIFVDDLDGSSDLDATEQQADALAAEALIPTEAWQHHKRSRYSRPGSKSEYQPGHCRRTLAAGAGQLPQVRQTAWPQSGAGAA